MNKKKKSNIIIESVADTYVERTIYQWVEKYFSKTNSFWAEKVFCACVKSRTSFHWFHTIHGWWWWRWVSLYMYLYVCVCEANPAHFNREFFSITNITIEVSWPSMYLFCIGVCVCLCVCMYVRRCVRMKRTGKEMGVAFSSPLNKRIDNRPIRNKYDQKWFMLLQLVLGGDFHWVFCAFDEVFFFSVAIVVVVVPFVSFLFDTLSNFRSTNWISNNSKYCLCISTTKFTRILTRE